MNWTNFKYTALLWIFTGIKLPLIAFVSPRIIELGDTKCIIKIPLGFKTKNHLNVMYFGALAIGAELSIALKAVEQIYKGHHKIDFIFKDFKVDFLKRADGHVHFIFEDAQGVTDLIAASSKSTERMEKKFKAHAIVPTKGNDPIAQFELTLSVKNRALKG